MNVVLSKVKFMTLLKIVNVKKLILNKTEICIKLTTYFAQKSANYALNMGLFLRALMLMLLT